MAKVDLDLVKAILKRNDLDTRMIGSIIEDIQQELKMLQEENPPALRQKKQFAIMVSDPEGILPKTDLTGWILQLPEEDPPYVAEERITRAAYEFNQTPKGRRLPVKSIGEACEAVPPRLLKEQNVWVKTKEPVLVLRTNNQIPFDKLKSD